MRLLVAAAVAIGLAAPQPDRARVLADMRQALGGEHAIAGVQAFSVSGSGPRTPAGHPPGASVAWTAVLPDRVVRVRRLWTPWGNHVETDGFRGDTRIY